MQQIAEEEWEEIKRSIFEKVRRRLAEDEEYIRLIEQGNTERFNRVLAQWLELERAIQERDHRNCATDQCTPWQCPDKRVREAWEKLTDPRNVLPLENLYYQLPDGPQLELAREALKVCRGRK
ncbi:MAG: hypothetical protein IH623_11245 [Verrucomicrobia bacterium]|nr:hypothetical protein [Verrucomicrobiota bacterium]